MNKNPCILIVDDNAENIRVLGTVLRKQNYSIVIAQDGEQALNSVHEVKPDLILLDIMMPKMDGFEVCKQLKENDLTKDIPIIFVSALTSHRDELAGLKAGAIDYIHKPFSLPLIKARIKAHIDLACNKEELKISRQELALKNMALEEAVKLRDDIERITRHDMKTPLNAIMGLPQLLLMDDNLTDDQRESLQDIIRAGNDVLLMINNSLNLFKIETGNYIYEPEEINLTSLLKTVVKDLYNAIANTETKINFIIDNEHDSNKSIFVSAEKILTYSLFSNLLLNALEASKHKGNITINIISENDKVKTIITNPGSVPESIRNNFFDKYATAGKANGTGLGTYSAKLMAEVQNGSITMNTNAQQTSICVFLCRK